MKKEQYKAWEAADRAKAPHAWAIHDHCVSQLMDRQMKRVNQKQDTSRVLIKGMFVIILILLAIIVTT